VDLERIRELVAGGESDTVEFKRSTGQMSRAGETLCAFLNGTGGSVLFGVSPDGDIVGQDVADGTLRDLAMMTAKLEPAARVTVSRTPVGSGREVLVLHVDVGVGAPYCFDGRPYQRVSSTTFRMPRERYRELLLERSHTDGRWELLPATGFAIEDLDREEILRSYRLGVESGRMPEAGGADTPEILDRLQLRRGGELTRAAVVLFARNPAPRYSQCLLRLARFRGTDRSEFLDSKMVTGHLLRLLDEAMTFLLRHIPIAGRFERGRIERIDEPLFPVAALREAVINALCHRTYMYAGGAVSIAIYDDRLEIWNDGMLPFGLRPEDLKRRHESRPRNPTIAGVLYRRGLIEQWGRGTQKVVELCLEAGLPEPDYGEEAGSFWVRFAASGIISECELTERQRLILDNLTRHHSLSVVEIVREISGSVSARTVRRDLNYLLKLKLVTRAGSGRIARWMRA
jgi:ATP-dependent DNA helicase RecG